MSSIEKPVVCVSATVEEQAEPDIAEFSIWFQWHGQDQAECAERYGSDAKRAKEALGALGLNEELKLSHYSSYANRRRYGRTSGGFEYSARGSLRIRLAEHDVSSVWTALASSEIKASIKKRKTGRPVRLEVETDCDDEALAFLEEMLPIEKSRVIRVTGPLDLTLFSKFASIPGCSSMCYDPIIPVAEPADFVGYEDIFAAIRAHDCMIHHPYESFDVVVDFVRAAAEDPDVLAIKQTLYRVSGHSPIVAALMRAAENGKQVTVLVELKARFDEENNIHWAQKLEKAGWHTTRSEFVDAPLIDELPMALECKLVSYDPQTCRLVGEIVNVSADERILGADGKIDPDKLDPITFDPIHAAYRRLGEKVGSAFQDGKQLM